MHRCVYAMANDMTLPLYQSENLGTKSRQLGDQQGHKIRHLGVEIISSFFYGHMEALCDNTNTGRIG